MGKYFDGQKTKLITKKEKKYTSSSLIIKNPRYKNC